jgi:hypothetical protein
MHHLVAFEPIPKTLVSFPPHAFRLQWERVKQRSGPAQTKSDIARSFPRPVKRALAPTGIAELVTVAATEATGARRQEELLDAAPAQWASEPPAEPAIVGPGCLENDWVIEMSRSRQVVGQVRKRAGDVRGVNSIANTKWPSAGADDSLAKAPLSRPPRRIEDEALLNARLLSVRCPTPAAVAAHFPPFYENISGSVRDLTLPLKRNWFDILHFTRVGRCLVLEYTAR